MKHILLILFVFSSLTAYNQTISWDGGGTDDNWNTANNWNTNTVPTSADDVEIRDDFPGAPSNVFVNVNSNAEAKSITLTGTARSVTIFLDVFDSLVSVGDIALTNGEIALGNEAVLFIGEDVLTSNGKIDPNSFYKSNNTEVVYNGTLSQSIYNTDYVDLTIANSGAIASLVSDLTVNRTFSILTGGSFSQNRFNLTLFGDFINDGTYSVSDGLVLFNGTTNISGASTTTFYNIDVTGSLTIGSPVQLKNFMTFTGTPTVDFGGTSKTSTLFTVLSSTATDATVGLGDHSVATIQNGFITVERYTSAAGEANWRYLTTPVKGVTVADWDDELLISNDYIGGDFQDCGSCTPSLFYYDESVPLNQSEGFIAFPDDTQEGSVTFEHGRGYSIWIFQQDRPVTIRMNGEIPTAANDGDLPVSFTPNTESLDVAHDGWNIVGNPYVANIDRKIVGDGTVWDFGADMYETIWVKDNLGKISTPGTYLTHNGEVGSNGWDGVVSMGQGFWVKADGPAASLSVSQAAKTSAAATLFRTNEEPTNVFRVFINQEDLRDEAIIHFKRGASDDIDRNMDAPKLYNPTINIATVSSSDDQDLTINTLPVSNRKDVSISIYPENPKGDYHLTFKGFETFEAFSNVYLYDAYLDETMEITAEDSIAFTINDDEGSFGKNRFTLTFSNIIMTAGPGNNKNIDPRVGIYPNPANEKAYIQITNENAELQVLSIEGKVLLKEHLIQGRNSVDLSSLKKGIYIFKVLGESVNYTERIVKN